MNSRMNTPLNVTAILCFAAALLTPARLKSAEPSGNVATGFYFPSTGATVEKQALLLSIDDYLLPIRENVGIYLSTPKTRKEPVLVPSKENSAAPDQVAANFYGAVLHEEGKYRMWYYAIGLKEPGNAYRPDQKNLLLGPVCYAESDDGLTWTKPNLGQVTFRGSKRNNAIALPDAMIEGVHVIKDEAETDPQRRYKMVYNPHDGKTWVIRTATSPDGLHWNAAEHFGIDQFLETASFYKFNETYVVHGQRITHSEGGHPSGRQGRAIISTDFDTWLGGNAVAFDLPEPAKPEERGPRKPYDQVHLGVGAASYGNVAIGLYGLWHNMPGDNDSQKRWGWFGYGKISCDLGLVISNDGLHFREPVKGRAYIASQDSPATPIDGKPWPTILCQSGNGILNVGDETRIYFGRWRNADYETGDYAEVALATLPRDRWGSLGLYPGGLDHSPKQSTGAVWSAPVRLPKSGCSVVLNADHARRMSVEIADEKFKLISAYSGTRSGKPTLDSGLDCPVTWTEGDLAKLGGQTVRFKINFERHPDADSRLFAVYLRSR